MRFELPEKQSWTCKSMAKWRMKKKRERCGESGSTRAAERCASLVVVALVVGRARTCRQASLFYLLVPRDVAGLDRGGASADRQTDSFRLGHEPTPPPTLFQAGSASASPTSGGEASPGSHARHDPGAIPRLRDLELPYRGSALPLGKCGGIMSGYQAS